MKIFKLFFGLLICFSLFSIKENNEKYQCMPCGRDCDKTTFNTAGNCPDCHMELVKSATINFKSISPNDICAYIKSHPKTILIDVRTKEEFEGKADPNFGTLKNAINVPIQELKTKLASISAYKNREVLVYCSHSHRSPQAAYQLTQNGFTNVINMNGGMSMVESSDCKTK